MFWDHRLLNCRQDLLPASLLGITDGSMSQYIEFKADEILRMLGFRPYFHANNPVRSFRVCSLHGSDCWLLL